MTTIKNNLTIVAYFLAKVKEWKNFDLFSNTFEFIDVADFS